MIRIRARPHESVEQLLRRFRKVCEREGIKRDVTRHSYYEKPSEKRRRKRRERIRRARKAARTSR